MAAPRRPGVAEALQPRVPRRRYRPQDPPRSAQDLQVEIPVYIDQQTLQKVLN